MALTSLMLSKKVKLLCLAGQRNSKREEIAVIRVRTKTRLLLLPQKGSRRQYQRRSMVRRKSRPSIKRGRRSANKRKKGKISEERVELFMDQTTMMCSPLRRWQTVPTRCPKKTRNRATKSTRRVNLRN